MFKPDQPIQSQKEDILGRGEFAQSVANAILSYKVKDSIVIGLFGAWGCGKTSIINLTIEYMEKASRRRKKNKPIIIRFNPWNFSDQNKLIAQFFKQLSIDLNREDYAGDAKTAGEKLEAYASFFEPLKLIPVVGQYAEIVKTVVQTTGTAVKDWGNQKQNDLDSMRRELNGLLAKQPHRIVVVIDDIDRLNNNEIRQVFQLIKSLADFPNTVYFLAFDKGVVINALEKVQEGNGLEYLEKVVQIPFEVPPISIQEIQGLLFSQLTELTKDIPEEKFDSVYWGNIYHSGLKHLFKNIRDVTRYINSLRFSFEMVKEEVNVVDFFAIIGVQVFLPEIYYGIRDNKDIFAGLFSDYEKEKEKMVQAQTRCDEIISRTSKYSKEVLTDFLKRLFPKLESIYGTMNYAYDYLDGWRKERRICSPEVFDIYFRLSIPKGEVSKREVETILSLANNPEALSESLLKLNEDGRAVRFLDLLEDYTRSDIPEANIEPIITVLMDIGDVFPEGDTGFFSINTPGMVSRKFYQLIHRFDNKEKRFDVLKNAMEKASRSLYTIVYEVAGQEREHGKTDSDGTPRPEEKLTLNAEQLDELKKIALKKIEGWAEDGRLKGHKYLLAILFMWKKWDECEKVKNFVNDMIKDDDGLIDFITIFLSKSTSHGCSDYVGKIHWRIDLKEVETFLELKRVEPRARRIFSSSDYTQLDDKKKLAIKTFLDTVDGKAKGFLGVE